ncbi:Lrp/AsnC family transcriptional regulator [Henriciella marina]|uniref:Lrp/AsnC family transcriptional regulator n=1 Tax=Henriciella marina TaxID=453851 RepID=A0ABT4LSB3_9PROT|nr:Lrp/AsnC family transcriptional regulator [Henriciella marina]MCZ4297252.1 Lrp/AsnC family transcriptional regulator [Henriciella marina]
MDGFDRRLLDLLQQDNRRTYDDLGEELGLSATAVRRRAARLREQGVIAADVSILNSDQMGISVIVSVRFEKESHATYEAFKTAMKAAPEVRQCYTVSGEVDFIVIAHFEDLPAYDDWVAETFLSNPAIARTTTNVVYRRVKFDTAIPV